MNRSSKSKSNPKRSRRKNRQSNNSVISGTSAGTATRSRGTARADQLFTLPLLGDKFECKRMLYYDSRFELTGAAGILKTYYFRANDVFDPDATGVGHQPIGFDQAMLFWEQFCVFSSKITVSFLGNTGQTVRCGIFLNPNTTDPPSFGDLMENGYLKTTIVSGQTGGASAVGYWGVRSLSMTCDAIRYFQYKGKEEFFANPNFLGNVATSPAEQVYFGIFTYDFTGANNTDVFFDVTLSYDVRFQEPRKISQSLLHTALKQVLQPTFNSSSGAQTDSSSKCSTEGKESRLTTLPSKGCSPL